MRTLLDFLEQTFDHVSGANSLPVRLGKGVESETGVAVAAQALDGGGIGGLVFGAEGAVLLVGGLAVGLIEDGTQLWQQLVVFFVLGT